VDHHCARASRPFEDLGDLGTDGWRIWDRLRGEQHVALNVDQQQRPLLMNGPFEVDIESGVSPVTLRMAAWWSATSDSMVTAMVSHWAWSVILE
jgi:hypothetical protein